MKFIAEARCQPRRIRRIAPSQPGSIVGASRCEPRNFFSNGGPIEARCRNPGFKNDGWTTTSTFDQVNTPAADTDHAPNWWKLPPTVCRANSLIEHPAKHHKQDGNSERNQEGQRE